MDISSEDRKSIVIYHYTYTKIHTFASRKISKLCGMSKEHRIPLKRIRFMTWDCYKKLRKVWISRGFLTASLLTAPNSAHLAERQTIFCPRRLAKLSTNKWYSCKCSGSYFQQQQAPFIEAWPLEPEQVRECRMSWSEHYSWNSATSMGQFTSENIHKTL